MTGAMRVDLADGALSRLALYGCPFGIQLVDVFRSQERKKKGASLFSNASFQVCVLHAHKFGAETQRHRAGVTGFTAYTLTLAAYSLTLYLASMSLSPLWTSVEQHDTIGSPAPIDGEQQPACPSTCE